MSRRRKSKTRNKNANKAVKSGHHQGKGYSDVYRDGKAYVYTMWDDNADEVGVEMDFSEWKKAYDGSASSGKDGKRKRGRGKKRKK